MILINLAAFFNRVNDAFLIEPCLVHEAALSNVCLCSKLFQNESDKANN